MHVKRQFREGNIYLATGRQDQANKRSRVGRQNINSWQVSGRRQAKIKRSPEMKKIRQINLAKPEKQYLCQELLPVNWPFQELGRLCSAKLV